MRDRSFVRPLLACLLLVGCSGNAASEPAPAGPDTAWIASLKPWYCGAEALPPKTAKDGATQAQSRDLAVRIKPGTGSFTAVYGSVNGIDKSVGSFTRLNVTGTGAATMRFDNDQRQNGDVTLAFAPDFSTVTVTWVAAKLPPGSSPMPTAPTVLTAAAGSSACVAGALIR